MKLSDDKVIMICSNPGERPFPWSQKRFVNDWYARIAKLYGLTNCPNYRAKIADTASVVCSVSLQIFEKRYQEQQVHGIPFLSTRIEEGELANAKDES